MKEDQKPGRWVIAVAWVTALIPCSYVVSLYALVVRSRSILGHWPSAEELSFASGTSLHSDVTEYLGVATVFAIFAVPALVAVCVRQKFELRTASRIFVPLIGAFCLPLLVVLFDPGQYHSWFCGQTDELAKQRSFRKWSELHGDRN